MLLPNLNNPLRWLDMISTEAIKPNRGKRILFQAIIIDACKASGIGGLELT